MERIGLGGFAPGPIALARRGVLSETNCLGRVLCRLADLAEIRNVRVTVADSGHDFRRTIRRLVPASEVAGIETSPNQFPCGVEVPERFKVGNQCRGVRRCAAFGGFGRLRGR